MPTNKKPLSSENKNISISGDVKNSVVISGDNNTVNQTIIQKFFNIFKSDTETLEHRNRRILLGHVENAWIKGVLDASLHGAALLDLGIKQDPEAVTKYPWAIKKESTDETLPAGTSMLEIFDSIGMGRSLLILGAPGSGKTTMLLELARQMIVRAREDVTEPIPMVFNLSSWTESKTLADWLAQELNNLYSVPRKTAPDWVKGDKLLLLLDGLDEVQQESRANCVEAINAFRQEHGLTSLAVCSRSQDYANLNAKLSFEGAVEVQPLTQEQIAEFFNRFGKEITGIKQVLKKDSGLREMTETPLFLSIMLMAYRDKQDVEILVSGDEQAQRKHLFDTYIERMFERPRLKNISFNKQNILCWLSWLSQKMIKHNEIPYVLENMQPYWLNQKKQVVHYMLTVTCIGGLSIGLTCWLIGQLVGPKFAQGFGLSGGLTAMLGLIGWLISRQNKISTVDSLSFNWKEATGQSIIVVVGLIVGLLLSPLYTKIINSTVGPILGFSLGLSLGLIYWLRTGLNVGRVDQITYPGQRLIFTAKNFLTVSWITWLIIVLVIGLLFELVGGLIYGTYIGLIGGLLYGGIALIQHFALRYILARNNLLPWRLIPFLDHCVDLIFLRRVGGGYIFVHRLLMEHFAEMYVETPTSKGN